jgi:hypothetical protein
MLVSFSIRGFASVGGLHGLFHAGDFFIRQKIEVVHAFLRGEPAVVLQTEADKEVDFPVGIPLSEGGTLRHTRC